MTTSREKLVGPRKKPLVFSVFAHFESVSLAALAEVMTYTHTHTKSHSQTNVQKCGLARHCENIISMLCVLIHFANCGAFLFTEQHFYFINTNPACLINSTHSDFSPFVHWHTEKSVSQLISIIGIDQAQLVSFSSSSFYLLLLHLLLYSSAFPSTSALSSVLSCDNLKQDDFRGAECRANPLPSLVFSLSLSLFLLFTNERQTNCA